MLRRPGGELATRPLHFIWITDCSGSMKSHGKIQALNTAIREALPHMQRVADENPNAEVLVRAVRFASGATWHVAQETPVGQFQWTDLVAGGTTDMGKALALVAEQLKMPPMSPRALPPVLVLVSDGQPTDNFDKGLAALLGEPWGAKAVRIAIAIGEDADHEVLKRFIAHPEIEPLHANNPEALVSYIKWVSTAVLQAASSPASQVAVAPSIAPATLATPTPSVTAPSGTGSMHVAGQGSAAPAAPGVPAVPASPALNIPVPVPLPVLAASSSVPGSTGAPAPADVW